MVRDSKKNKKKKKDEDKVYKSVVSGKLNLKSGKFKKSNKKSKRKKAEKDVFHKLKDKEKEKDEQREEKKDSKSEIKGFKSDFEKAMEEMTDSEKRFLERQKMNESYFIKKQSQMTHRERIEEYNVNLSNLSEHHDIPKVGPG